MALLSSPGERFGRGRCSAIAGAFDFLFSFSFFLTTIMSKFSTRQLKLDAVGRVDDLLEATETTVPDACRAVGCSTQQYYRWKRGSGLGKKGVPSDPEKRTGRPPAVALTDEEFAVLHWKAIVHGSTQLAVEEFLKTEVCEQETFEALNGYLSAWVRDRKKITWPMSVRRACKVTAEERAMHRGRKHEADILPVGFRRLVYVDDLGNEHALRPGDLYESDDMSVNQPFRYTNPETGEEELGRQTLLSQCVQSLRWLGASPLGRPRDAYRAEDIADHLLAVVQAAGLPLFWRFERGPWENDFINGVKLDSLGERFRGERWGALDDLFMVIRAYGSRGKGAIEGSFNFLQSLLTIHRHGSADIGRTRGEFEEATRAFLRARQIQNPEKRQRELDKFWTIDQAAQGFADAMADFVRRPKQRREWGTEMQVPIELWREGHPGKRPLAAENEWYFHPVKVISTVRDGQVTIKANHWPKPFVFTVCGVPGAHADYLPAGLRVLVAFHPGHPERGAYIANADTGSLNRRHWRFAECLVPAAPCWNLEAPPQIDLRSKAEKLASGVGQSKKAASSAMRSEFRAISEAGQAADAPRISTARDGKGNALHAATGVELARTTADGSRGRGERPASGGPAPRGTTPRSRVAADSVTEDEEAAALAKLGS